MSLYGVDGFGQSACGWQRRSEDVCVYTRQKQQIVQL